MSSRQSTLIWSTRSKQAEEISEIAILKMGRRIFNIHAFDNIGNIMRPLHQTPGRGGFYWEGALRTLKAVEFDGFIELELTDMINDEASFVEENQNAITHLREAGKRAGIRIE